MQDTREFERALLKLGLYKEFLDELVPLSCFAVLAYPEDYAVQLVLGNQPFDAVVYDSSGAVVDRVELTTPQDGRSEAADRTLVAGRGFGKCVVGTPGDDLLALFPHVLETCEAKALKDYRGCSLVIAIEPLSPFEGFESNFDDQVDQLTAKVRAINFQADRVYLLLMPGHLITVHG